MDLEPKPSGETEQYKWNYL